MKKIVLLLLLLSSLRTNGQVTINSVIQTVNNALGAGLSNEEITKGLKEALNVGTKNASGKAAKTDGYYKNKLIRIPFPSDARDMRTTLMKMGMKKQVDAFEKQMNRAA